MFSCFSPFLYTENANARNTFPRTLMFNTLGKIFSRQHTEVFSYFFQKIGDNSCKLSPLFSGKYKKNIINVSSDELAQRMVTVKVQITLAADILKYHFSEKIRPGISWKLYLLED